jgi:hypothetical protein
MTGVGVALKIREMAGGAVRAALWGLGLVLMAQQAHAACNRIFKEGPPLVFDEGETGRVANPYSLSSPTEPSQLHKGECGTWAVRTFVLHTKRGQAQADHPVGRPSVGDRSQRAGYSNGGDDVFVVPVLLLTQPSREGELNDSRIWDFYTFDRQAFQQLKFTLKDNGIRGRWRFRPFSGLFDKDGSNEVVNFIASCGDGGCTWAELAEAVELAKSARSSAPVRGTTTATTTTTTTTTTTPTTTQHPGQAKSTFLRLYDASSGEWVGSSRPVSAFTACGDRESNDKPITIGREGSKIDILSPAREPTGLCFVFNVSGTDRCYQVPLPDGGKRGIPAEFSIFALPDAALEMLPCPPLSPFNVDLKITSLDGRTTVQPSVLRDLNAYPKVFNKDIDGREVAFEKDEIRKLRANSGLEQYVTVERKVAAVKSVTADVSRRRLAISIELQIQSIGAMRFELMKGTEEARNCEVMLDVPSRRHIGSAWGTLRNRSTGLPLTFDNNKGYLIQGIDDSKKASLFVSMAPDENEPLRLKPKEQWVEDCTVAQAEVTREEIVRGVVRRDVGVPGPGLVGFLTVDPELSKLLKDREREVLFGLGAGLLNKLSQKIPAKGWSFGTIVDAQMQGLGNVLKVDAVAQQELRAPEADKIRAIGQRVSQTTLPLPVSAISASVDQLLKERNVAADRWRVYPADIVYFGKVLNRFGSLCDSNSDVTVRNWGNDAWQTGGRRLMVVTVVAQGEVRQLISDGFLMKANQEDSQFPVYKCKHSFGETSRVEHYVLQAPDAVDVAIKGDVENFLVKEASRLFEIQ